MGCWDMKRNGGHTCYRGIYLHQKVLTEKYGCPSFINRNEPVVQSKAFCWCGYDPTPRKDHPQVVSTWWDAMMFGESMNLTANTSANLEIDLDRRPRPTRHPRPTVHPRPTPHPATINKCKNRFDFHALRHIPQPVIQADLAACAHDKYERNMSWSGYPTSCMQKKLHVSAPCASCFGSTITCSHQHCLSECACGQTPACRSCTQKYCEQPFDTCSGARRRQRHRRPHSEEFVFEDEDEGADGSLVVVILVLQYGQHRSIPSSSSSMPVNPMSVIQRRSSMFLVNCTELCYFFSQHCSV